MNAIIGYTRKATTEILGITMPVTPVHSRPCPKCGKGNVVIRAKTARCDNTSCGMLLDASGTIRLLFLYFFLNLRYEADEKSSKAER